MKLILATALCTSAAIIGQISTASAQYYYGSPAAIYHGSPQPLGPPGPYYYYGSPAGIYYAQPH